MRPGVVCSPSRRKRAVFRHLCGSRDGGGVVVARTLQCQPRRCPSTSACPGGVSPPHPPGIRANLPTLPARLTHSARNEQPRAPDDTDSAAPNCCSSVPGPGRVRMEHSVSRCPPVVAGTSGGRCPRCAALSSDPASRALGRADEREMRAGSGTLARVMRGRLGCEQGGDHRVGDEGGIAFGGPASVEDEQLVEFG